MANCAAAELSQGWDVGQGKFFLVSNHRIHADYGTPGILGTSRIRPEVREVISLLVNTSRLGTS